MSNGNNGRKKKLEKKTLLALAGLLLISIVVTVLAPEEDSKGANTDESQQESTSVYHTEKEQQDNFTENSSTQNTEEVTSNKELIFSMVDVGQADGFVLEYGDMVAVIDCGTSSTCGAMVNYLHDKEINQIDLLFGTHPHDDHMGGMMTILENFEIGKVIIPEAENITSDWYMELEDELAEGDYDVRFIKEGDVYYMDEVTITVLEQLDNPIDDINNYSAIMKITLGEMDIIMTGDAETKVEKELLQSGKDISAEVLKIGHHGSTTSTSMAFLNAVNPTYALISSGVGNRYKHPTEKIMERLESKGIITYRTDECGTVVLTITPTDITFNCEPGDYLSGTELKEKMRNAS